MSEAKAAQDDELALLAEKDPLAAKAQVEAKYNVKVDTLDEKGRAELIERLKREDPEMGKDIAKWEDLQSRQVALDTRQNDLDRQYMAMAKDFERFGQRIAEQRGEWEKSGNIAAATAARLAEWDARGSAADIMADEADAYRVRIEMRQEAFSRRKPEEIGDLIGLPPEQVPAYLEKMRETEHRFLRERGEKIAERRDVLQEEKATAAAAAELPPAIGKELREWQGATRRWDGKQAALRDGLERLIAVASGAYPDWEKLAARRKQWETESDAQENARHDLVKKRKALEAQAAANEGKEWAEPLAGVVEMIARADKARQLEYCRRQLAAIEKADKAVLGKLFGIAPEKIDAELAQWKESMSERMESLRAEISAAPVRRLASVEEAVMSVDGARVRFQKDREITPEQWQRINAESNRSPRALVGKSSDGRPDYLFFGDVRDGKAFVPTHGYDLREHRLFEVKQEAAMPVKASHRSAAGYVADPDPAALRRLRESVPRKPRAAADLPPQMQTALAQAMDRNYPGKPKPDTGEALVAAPTPGLPGGVYRG